MSIKILFKTSPTRLIVIIDPHSMLYSHVGHGVPSVCSKPHTGLGGVHLKTEQENCASSFLVYNYYNTIPFFQLSILCFADDGLCPVYQFSWFSFLSLQ